MRAAARGKINRFFMPKIKQESMISNELGLHARASAKLVQAASKFRSEVSLCVGDEAVDAKSILGVLTLAAVKGTPVVVIADGEDADGAISALTLLINDKFGEGK